MCFEKHLFISYAHIDDRPLCGHKQGWVAKFHQDLESRLAWQLGYEPKIWRDNGLAGNDDLHPEIAEQLRKSAILVSVVTPRYIESDSCKTEVEEFCRAAEQSGGVTVDNKWRIVKVLKNPMELEAQPPVMQRAVGYEFYKRDPDDQDTILELDEVYGPEIAQLFHRKMQKLASELAKTIKLIVPKNGKEPEPAGVPASAVAAAHPSLAAAAAVTAPAPSAKAKPVVYLAECGFDCGDEREMIETELRAHGYEVLPDRQLPIEEADYIREVTAMIERADVSVHLIGQVYGKVPDGPSEKSAAVIQNDLAVQRSKDAGLRRLIWLAGGTASKNSLQQAFLDRIQNDADAQFGADLVVADLDTVKTTLHSMLKKLEEPPPAACKAAVPTVEKIAYVICDERDREALRPLGRLLTAAGYQVKRPLYCGDAEAIRKHHQEFLAKCELLIVFYGHGDEIWKESVESDLRKAVAYRNGNPLPKQATYIAEPSRPDKQDLIDWGVPGVIDGLGEFPQASLAELLK